MFSSSFTFACSYPPNTYYSEIWNGHTRWVFAFNNLTLPSRAPDTHKEDYMIQSPYTYSRMDIQAHNTSFMPLVSIHHRRNEWLLLSFEWIAHFICFQFPKFNCIIKRSANEKLGQILRMKVPDQKDWSYSMWCCLYDHSKSRVQTFDKSYRQEFSSRQQPAPHTEIISRNKENIVLMINSLFLYFIMPSNPLHLFGTFQCLDKLSIGCVPNFNNTIHIDSGEIVSSDIESKATYTILMSFQT